MSQEAANVLIVMSDQHNPSVSSAYGHPFVQTPALDRLAARGTVFESAYCNSPLCVPSRMSFLTGKHVHRIGAWDLGTALSSEEPTWAHRLNARGYETALIGKMHFIGPDQRHGFAFRDAQDVEPLFRRRAANAYRPARWDSSHRAAGVELLAAEPGNTPFQAYDDQVLAAAERYLRHAAARSEPWAACVSFISPHDPFVVREEYWQRYHPEHADLPATTAAELERLHPQNRRLREGWRLTDVPEETVRRARAGYYGLVSFVDDRIGQLLDLVEELELDESTVVVYVSDHGEMLGEHGLWFKLSFYDPSVRVPMILSWPGRFPAGRRLRRVVSLLDLVRTILDLAGAESEGLDGESLLQLLRGEEADGGGRALAEYEGPLTDRPARMIRDGRHKLNYYWNEPIELFDLEADPGELRDLAGDPARRETVDELTAAVLDGWDPAEIDARVRESQRRRRLLVEGEPVEPDTWLLGGRVR